MNFFRAVFCCTCCVSVEDDDQYRPSTKVRIEDHFKSEVTQLNARRHEDHAASLKSNQLQIQFRMQKLRLHVQDQWTLFQGAFGKYRPLLDFIVAQKIEELARLEEVSRDRANSVMAAHTPQRASNGQVGNEQNTLNWNLLAKSGRQQATLRHSIATSASVSDKLRASLVPATRDDSTEDLIKMYAALTFLVDRLGVLCQNNLNDGSQLRNQANYRLMRQKMLQKESMPTIFSDQQSSSSFMPHVPRTVRQKSAHIKQYAHLAQSLEERVEPSSFSTVQIQVGFEDAEKLLTEEWAESDQEIGDFKSDDESSVAQLFYEDEMDKRERQYSLSVDILKAFRKAVSFKSSFFLDLYDQWVLKPHKEPLFNAFFDSNWLERHYGIDSGRVLDEIIKKAAKRNEIRARGKSGADSELELMARSPTFKAPKQRSREVSPFLDQSDEEKSADMRPLNTDGATERKNTVDKSLSDQGITPGTPQSSTYRLDPEIVTQELVKLKDQQQAFAEQTLQRHQNMQAQLKDLLSF